MERAVLFIDHLGYKREAGSGMDLPERSFHIYVRVLCIFLIRRLPSLSEFHIAEQRGDSRDLLEPKDLILIHTEVL